MRLPPREITPDYLAPWIGTLENKRVLETGEGLIINNKRMLHGKYDFVGKRALQRAWFEPKSEYSSRVTIGFKPLGPY